MVSPTLARVLSLTGFASDAATGDAPVPGLRSGFGPDAFHLEAAFSERSGLEADLVYETVDGPILAMKDVGDVAPADVHAEHWHEIAWNLGLAPLLWVVTPVDVRVFDAFGGLGREKGGKPIGTYRVDVAEEMATLDRLCGRLALDSGSFWESDLAAGINRRGRVDRVLLEEIVALEGALVGKVEGEAVAPARAVCQELIVCTLFAAYLLERELASPPALGQGGLAGAYRERGTAVALFEWLHENFNGDVFPEGVGTAVDDARLDLLRRFVEGEHLAKRSKGQLQLFPFRFEVIPIELISSVYEEFARRSAGSSADAQGLHYTPVNLVHMALDPAFDGLGADAHVLDPTCGSGLFLVQSLRRLVWKKCGDGPRTRAVVRRVLHDQIHGIDINDAALRIAAFSLYLAAVELESSPGTEGGSTRFDPLLGVTLHKADLLVDDARTVLGDARIDVIVGNLPWTHTPGRRPDRSNAPRPRRSPDQEILVNVAGLVGGAGRVALYLKGSPFFSGEPLALAARDRIIKGFHRLGIVNLAPLRGERLFPGARAPALLLCANCGHLPGRGKMLVATVPWTADFRRSGAVALGAADTRIVTKAEVLRTPSFLKAATVGTLRDARLMADLEGGLGTLGDLLSSLGIHEAEEVKVSKGALTSDDVRRGQGFQIEGAKAKSVSDAVAVLPALFPDDYAPFDLDATPLPSLRERGIRTLLFERNRNIYEGPVLICPKSSHRRALQPGRFSAAVVRGDVAFSESFYGVSFRGRDVRLADVLCAILNSAVPGFQFLFGAGAIGIERPTVSPHDLMRLRIPHLKVDDALHRRALAAMRSASTDACRALDDLAADLYLLGAGERILVRDAVARGRSAFLDTPDERSADAEPPGEGAMRAYSDVVSRTIGAVLRFDGPRRLAATMAPPRTTDRADPLSSFAAVRFTVEDGRDGRGGPTIATAPGMEDFWARVGRHMVGAGAPYLRERRSLRIYGDGEVTVVKPAQVRYWNAARGFEDADAILADHWARGRS